ncbi:MAG: phosphoenolpyruvate carboxylase [Proteobacteria bacterium]|nr:phosphoenolpyruvate carboxylase [Pseudomonadota bacterium]
MPSSASSHTTPTYSLRFQRAVADAFIRVVEERYPEAAAWLRQKIAVAESTDAASRKSAYEALAKTIKPEQLTLFLEMDNKLVDMQWRARKIAGITVVNALANAGVMNEDKFEHVISRFKEAGLTSAQVQVKLDEVHTVWPSLTSHPTNPTNFLYSEKGMAIDVLLSHDNTDKQLFTAALRAIRDTPITGTKRTPEEEADELVIFLDMLYASVIQPTQNLQDALLKYGYSDVKLNRPIIEPCVWGPGDGDGNPKMTEPLLSGFCNTLRNAILSRYRDEILAIVSEWKNSGRTREVVMLAGIAGEIDRATASVVQPVAQIKELAASCPPGDSAKVRLQELAMKMEIFGTRFAYIDVRHNAKDLLLTLSRVLAASGKHKSDNTLLRKGMEAQAHEISDLLGNEEWIRSVADLKPESLIHAAVGNPDEEGKTAARILGRLKVIGREPHMFQKLIIAEAKTPAHALAAMLLLKITGSKVAVEGASIDVVPLLESRMDLQAAPKLIDRLARDPIFSKHCRIRGRLITMIAKSDSARLSGAGVQGQQEKAVGKVLALNTDAYGFKACIMLGGGDDQMRGGGRIVESPHVVMRAQAREGGKNTSCIAFTTQGLQNQLLFGAPALAMNFIEGFSAQMLVANARAEGLMPWQPVPQNVNEVQAYLLAKEYFKTAMDAYEAAIGTPANTDKHTHASPERLTIIDYMAGYPSEVIGATNLSSRPLSRKKGNDPIEGRAISLDQHAKHDGAYFTATEGVREALDFLSTQPRYGGLENGKPMSPARHCYCGNKSFRDNLRLLAAVLHQKDYDVAWDKRGGRPSAGELAVLAAEYKPRHYNEPRVYLAHLEVDDFAVARMIYEAITGREAPEAPFTLKSPLETGWPDLAEQMDYRERQSEFGKRMEVTLANHINALKKDKKEIPNELLLQASLAYIIANYAYSAPSFSLTMTDTRKDKFTFSERHEGLQAALVIPAFVAP